MMPAPVPAPEWVEWAECTDRPSLPALVLGWIQRDPGPVSPRGGRAFAVGAPGMPRLAGLPEMTLRTPGRVAAPR